MKRIAALLLLLFLLCGCTAAHSAAADIFCMDTVMNLQIWGRDADKAIAETSQLLRELDSHWSAVRDDSVTAAMNRGETDLSAEDQALVDAVCALEARTGGAFHSRLYALSELWGFPGKEYRVPSQSEIDAALTEEKWDFGASLKGYAGQKAADLLSQLDVDRAILSLGGNVQTYGSKPDGSPWQIGIRNLEGGDSLGIISLTGTASVITSGSYQRYFEQDGIRYCHIIDPRTGCPARSGLVSVTVICRDGLTADALSTALFVLGLEDSTALWRESSDFEAVFVTDDGRILATEGANLSGCEYEVIRR